MHVLYTHQRQCISIATIDLLQERGSREKCAVAWSVFEFFNYSSMAQMAIRNMRAIFVHVAIAALVCHLARAQDCPDPDLTGKDLHGVDKVAALRKRGLFYEDRVFESMERSAESTRKVARAVLKAPSERIWLHADSLLHQDKSHALTVILYRIMLAKRSSHMSHQANAWPARMDHEQS